MISRGPFETDRLLLRCYEDADAEAVHQALDLDPDVWRFDPGFERTLEDRKKILSQFKNLHRQFGFGPCAAFSKEDNLFIGQGGLNPYVYDHRNGSRTIEFEVMFKVAKPFWRNGYALEMARFWVDFAFTEVRLPRLCTAPVRTNIGAVGLLTKLGCRFEDDWLDPETVIGVLENPGSLEA